MNTHLEEYTRFVPFLKDMLPGIYDIVIVDLESGEQKILEQSDWSNLNSKMIKETLIRTLKSHKKGEPLPAYEKTIQAYKGRLFKLFFYYIQEAGEVVGALCVSMECDGLLRMVNLLQETVGDEFREEEEKQPELKDIPAMVAEFCDDPAQLTTSERKEIFVDLFDAGVFRLKGAVGQVAEALCMSEKTAYRYLAEIRKARS